MIQQTKPRKILIVDDDKNICDVIVDILGFEGYPIKIAHNGLEALNFLQGEENYLVFLDLLMPLMGGRAVCNWLGTSHSHVVILMSAINNLTDISSLHVNDTLPKPFTADELILVVQRYMT